MEEDKKEEGKKTVEIVLPGASAIDKVLGPVLGEVGEDLYCSGLLMSQRLHGLHPP
jgi:hypothetical protein